MVKNSKEVPLLVAQTGPLVGQRWALLNKTLLGREPNCDIVIADRQVSRHHARLSPTPEGVILEDLNSKNGTHCNGQPLVEPISLNDGDIIQISLAQQFVYLSSDATLPLEVGETDFQTFQTTRLRLEKRSRRIWIGDEEVLPPLSASQFKLLELLYQNQDRVVPRPKLIEHVWGVEQAVVVSEQALDALIRRLRDRLASVDSSHSYVLTVRGHGLRLDNPPLLNFPSN
ncbi:MAG TPA: FHA domain-containing protein [bacterium]|nr:FHA domain-containing protein [bacterium]